MYKNPNEKTIMCTNINNPGGCKYGVNCRYAHSVDELVVKTCDYGDQCIFVKYEDCKIVNDNDKNKVCTRKHPGETNVSYISRINSKNDSVPFSTNWVKEASKNKHYLRYSEVEDYLVNLLESGGEDCLQLYIDYEPEEI